MINEYHGDLYVIETCINIEYYENTMTQVYNYNNTTNIYFYIIYNSYNNITATIDKHCTFI